ncbi:MAG TPA: BON domain-containing protein [Candidatus Baltobacteraceae bacterium]|jgi:osmotically-inducible protein OsmY|nr:BON domain-containing protein [Candidatus Baltobacteraceae bacterium]
MKVVVAMLLFAAAASCSGGQQKNAGNDALVTVAVKAKLAAVDVDSTDAVGVSVANGTVTLTGKAHSQRERQEYVAAARSADGVTGVDDRLAIDPNERGVREQSADVALAGKVSAAIAGQAGINVFHTKVTAHDGAVTIDGTVPSSSVARTIVDTARGVNGVKSVVSRLAVYP